MQYVKFIERIARIRAELRLSSKYSWRRCYVGAEIEAGGLANFR